MSIVRRAPWRAALTTVVLTGTVLATGSLSASGAEPAAGQRGAGGCLTRTFDEQSVNVRDVGPAGPPAESVGDGGVYYDVITDPAGHQIGTAIGYYTDIAQRPSDGHLISEYHETVHLADGDFRDAAVLDRTAVIEGGWARFDAVGVTGVYAGRHGIRQWRVIDVPTLTAEVQVNLCS